MPPKSLMTATAPFMETIHVLGSGSVGLLWAASIRSAFPSYPLAVVCRSHHQPRIDANNGLMTVCLQQRGRIRLAHVPGKILDRMDPRKCNLSNVIVSTKSYQAVDAVESIATKLSPNGSRLILIGNGVLSVRQRLRGLFLRMELPDPQPELVLGVSTHGVRQDPPDDELYHLEHVGFGRCFIEEREGTKSLAEMWDRSGLQCQAIPPDQMEVLLWQKLAANAVCNPLTTLWDVVNGELRNDQRFERLQSQIIQEVSKVALQIAPLEQPSISPNDNRLSPDAMRHFVGIVIDDNLCNKSSMWQDVSKGQTTEIDDLNGFVCDQGKKYGVDCPANTELRERIQEISANRQVPP